MNGYKAFFLVRDTEVHASSSYEAYKKAVAFFRPSKSKAHMVHVVLCEKNGEQVTHSTFSL